MREKIESFTGYNFTLPSKHFVISSSYLYFVKQSTKWATQSVPPWMKAAVQQNTVQSFSQCWWSRNAIRLGSRAAQLPVPTTKSILVPSFFAVVTQRNKHSRSCHVILSSVPRWYFGLPSWLSWLYWLFASAKVRRTSYLNYRRVK